MRWFFASACFCLGLAAFAGCAVGAGDEGEDAGSSGGVVFDSGRRDTGSSSQDASTGGDGAASGDASTDARSDGAVVSDGNVALCANPTMCNGAQDAGAVKGDKPSTPVTLTGTTSRWVKVRVNEDDSGPLGEPQTLRVTLDSPPGSNFDLFLYDQAPTQCTTPDFSSTTMAQDNVEIMWGETGVFSNGNDDSRDVYVEVRYAGGACPPTGSWTLTFTGDI